MLISRSDYNGNPCVIILCVKVISSFLQILLITILMHAPIMRDSTLDISFSSLLTEHMDPTSFSHCELRTRDVTGASTTMFSRDTCLDNKFILLTWRNFGRASRAAQHYTLQVYNLSRFTTYQGARRVRLVDGLNIIKFETNILRVLPVIV